MAIRSPCGSQAIVSVYASAQMPTSYPGTKLRLFMSGLRLTIGPVEHRMTHAARLVLDLEQRLVGVDIDDIDEAILVLVALLGDQPALHQLLVRAGEVGERDLDVVPVVRRQLACRSRDRSPCCRPTCSPRHRARARPSTRRRCRRGSRYRSARSPTDRCRPERRTRHTACRDAAVRSSPARARARGCGCPTGRSSRRRCPPRL